ncbi:MAG: glycosyltransferase [Candidatus Nanopelagicales bacterium]
MPDSSTSRPLVTVGLTVHNEPIEVLYDAVKSVYAQTLEDWELVIARDGVTDEIQAALDKLADPRVRVIGDDQNLGVGVRHNQITADARGTFIAKLDGDDIMFPERLATQVAFLTDRPDNAVVGTGALIIDQFNEVRGERTAVRPHNKPADALSGVPVTHPTAMARTSWFEAHPYDEALIRSQDFGLWISSYNDTEFFNIDDPLLFYRITAPMKYNRFARRYKYARQAIRKLGNNVATTTELAKAWALTWVKQAGAAAGFATGKQDAFYNRTLVPLSEPELDQAQQILQVIARTEVPGWSQ